MPSVRAVVTYARSPRLPYPCTTRGHGPRHRYMGWPRAGTRMVPGGSTTLQPGWGWTKNPRIASPSPARFFPGEERLAYGARTLTEGGLRSLPQLHFHSGTLIECSAGVVNTPKINGRDA
ncbi:hypothetical protein DFH09DRAFT_1482369 [Mycena vulgaris]|nr:hypothetical protein DFH09DRAFT_1482369 [Mycena vulgaris]